MLIFTYRSVAQSLLGQDTLTNPIDHTLPFLRIATDSRASALGETGIATSPDANSSHWNPSKLAFATKDIGVSISITPWLRKITGGDITFSYLAFYMKINETQAIASSFTYFDLGSIDFTNNSGDIFQTFNPREYALDFSYARKINDKLSASVTGRFIHSNLAGNIISSATNIEIKPLSTGSVDIAMFYSSDDLQLGNLPIELNAGFNISNIGPKVSYSSNSMRFIPTNLGVGTAITFIADMYSKFTWAIDINKLLVPTPNGSSYSNGEPSYINGVFGSFNDAPNGFSEEIAEILLTTGIEYWYNDIFAARIGYFNEAAIKGNRKFFSFGLGIQYQKIGLDFSYLVPNERGHPLENTYRFTLFVSLDKKKNNDRN